MSQPERHWRAGVVLALAAITSASACASTDRAPSAGQATTTAPAAPAATAPAITIPAPAAGAASTAASLTPTGFAVTSAAVGADGRLGAQFTCDGTAVSPPLAWRGAPAGTVGFAVVMHHVAAPDDIHWYWLVYDLPATIDHLDEAATPPGKVGTNSVNRRTAYAPPCSQGPGDKTYTLTVYALSEQPSLPEPSKVTRSVLLDAISDRTLASATMNLVYARPSGSATAPPPPGPAPQGGNKR